MDKGMRVPTFIPVRGCCMCGFDDVLAVIFECCQCGDTHCSDPGLMLKDHKLTRPDPDPTAPWSEVLCVACGNNDWRVASEQDDYCPDCNERMNEEDEDEN